MRGSGYGPEIEYAAVFCNEPTTPCRTRPFMSIMSPTPGYRFINVGAEEGNFQPVDKAARSHAIRTAFQKGSSEMGVNTALTSKDTVVYKSQLKGRFRLSSRTTKKRGKQTASDSRVRLLLQLTNRHTAARRSSLVSLPGPRLNPCLLCRCPHGFRD